MTIEVDRCLEKVSFASYAQKLSWTLTIRQLFDVECLLTEAFFPLRGFMSQNDYTGVCETMRLANGQLWPMPITLDVSQVFAQELTTGETIVLKAPDQTPIALLTINSIWQPNKTNEAQQVFGTEDPKHPGVNDLFYQTGDWYLGGQLQRLTLPRHFDFIEHRHTPAQLKEQFRQFNWNKIIAFQTRNPMHRAHFELTQRAAMDKGANLLLHPVVGCTKPGDIHYITRVKCYLKILEKYQHHGVMLSLLPLAMRMAGPREALWHALIRKNYGATHFIVGRDHAGPGANAQGVAFYEPYEAQQLLLKHSDEIGIQTVPVSEMVYIKEKKQFLPVDSLEDTDKPVSISGTELRRKLLQNEEIPEWFTFPEVVSILKQSQPSLDRQGLTILFTGLSGAGKSTLAAALQARIQEISNRTITILDGDIARSHLSSELGFSPADREKHIGRLGYVASEITKHNGLVVIAAIAPYETMRTALRNQISAVGNFLEIYLSTPIDICKHRDVKGLYSRAKQGNLPQFTGISAPYEPPINPDMIIDTDLLSIEDGVNLILQRIRAFLMQQP